MTDFLLWYFLIGLALHWFALVFLKVPVNAEWKVEFIMLLLWPLAIGVGFVRAWRDDT